MPPALDENHPRCTSHRPSSVPRGSEQTSTDKINFKTVTFPEKQLFSCRAVGWQGPGCRMEAIGGPPAAGAGLRVPAALPAPGVLSRKPRELQGSQVTCSSPRAVPSYVSRSWKGLSCRHGEAPVQPHLLLSGLSAERGPSFPPDTSALRIGSWLCPLEAPASGGRGSLGKHLKTRRHSEDSNHQALRVDRDHRPPGRSPHSLPAKGREEAPRRGREPGRGSCQGTTWLPTSQGLAVPRCLVGT